MQNDSITLRYRGKSRQFRYKINTNEIEFLKLIYSFFNIKHIKSIAFADSNGQLYDISQVINRIPSLKNPQYDLMVIDSNEDNYSTKEDTKSSNSGYLAISHTDGLSRKKLVTIIIVRNFGEFERMLSLQERMNQISLLFMIDNKDQLNDIYDNYNDMLMNYQNKFDIYCYLKNIIDQQQIIDVIVNRYPILIIYKGQNKILELVLKFNNDGNILQNLLNKIYQNINTNYNNKSYGNIMQFKDQILQEMYNKGEINEKDYYYLKFCTAENRHDLDLIFMTFKRNNNVQEFKRDLINYLNEKSLKYEEIKERPQTSNGISYMDISNDQSKSLPTTFRRSANKNAISINNIGNRIANDATIDMINTHEKYIQIISDLEDKNLINEDYANIIKNLILEDNIEITKAIVNYINDIFDDITLCNILMKLIKKINGDNNNNIARPTSPYPKKDKLIKLVNSLVRKRLSDDNDLLLLNKLILEEDELVYSTFDVFESDRDEEDLLETLIKIVQKYKKSKKFNNEIYAPINTNIGSSLRYNSNKIPLNHHDKDFIKTAPQIIPLEQGNNHVNSFRNIMLETSTKIDQLPATITSLKADSKTSALIKQSLKQLDEFKKLKCDEYGMIFWLVENELQLVVDIIDDYHGISNLKNAVNSLVLLGLSKLNKHMRENFNEDERRYIIDNKEDTKSSIYTAFHCFKYDSDMPTLISSLKEIINANKESISPILKKETFASGIFGSKSLLEPGEELNPVLSKNQSMNENIKLSNFTKVESENTQNQLIRSPSKKHKKEDTNNGDVKSPGRKYQALLSSNKRNDNFKGQFQLRLMSGDDPDIYTPRKEDIDGNKLNGEFYQQTPQPISVIMPPKNDLNPFAQDLIDKFYESQESTYFHTTIFKKMISEAKFLTPDNIKSLEYLMENNHHSLLEAIFTYEINQNIKSVENQLKELSNQDLSNISISSSPREKKRMMIFHSFRSLLHTLKSTKQISDKHYKTFLYLYMEEQVSVLACYEVYLLTGDLKELLDTLFIIEKIEFFKNESKFFSDIEAFNDVIEQQLKIIYSFKKYLSLSTRVTLEKIIRTGNASILKIYNEFKQNKAKDPNSTFKYKNDVIHKLISFAEENSDIIKEYERIIYEKRVNNDGKNNKRKEIIEGFEETKLIKNIAHMDMVYELIDADHELIHSIFEVYEFTKDKMDFIENLKIVYDFTYKQKLLAMLKTDSSRYSEDQMEKFEKLINEKSANLFAAYELYLATKDSDEFFETADMVLRKKNK